MGKKTEDKEKKVKKFQSAYLFFFKEEKERIEKENEEKKITIKYSELLKQIGKKWLELPEEKKKKYHLLEEKDKEKFMMEKKEKNYAYKRSKKPKKPKRFRTAFMIYLKEQKKVIKKDDIINSLKMIGRTWRNLSESERKAYAEKEREDKLRYQKEYMVYMEEMLKMEETRKEKESKRKRNSELIEKLYNKNENNSEL